MIFAKKIAECVAKIEVRERQLSAAGKPVPARSELSENRLSTKIDVMEKHLQRLDALVSGKATSAAAWRSPLAEYHAAPTPIARAAILQANPDILGSLPKAVVNAPPAVKAAAVVSARAFSPRPVDSSAAASGPVKAAPEESKAAALFAEYVNLATAADREKFWARHKAALLGTMPRAFLLQFGRGQRMHRAEYDSLSRPDRQAYIHSGGKLTDDPAAASFSLSNQETPKRAPGK